MMTEFKEFRLASSYYLRKKIVKVDDNGLFNIRPTKKKINANLISFDGKYPYVARGTGNNGIRGNIDYDTRYLNPGNTISFGQDTATMYYQENEYFTGDKIQIFSLNPKLGFKLNYRIAIYLITVARKLFTNFAWGQSSFAVDKIAYMKINLPVISGTNKIDFKYMEDRVKALEQDQVKALDNYLAITGLNDYKLTEEDRTILNYKPKFDDFKIVEIFRVLNTKSILKSQVEKLSRGKTPYITAAEGNNAVFSYIDCPSEWIDEGNCVFIGGKSMVVTYQEKDFCSNDSHNLALYYKDDKYRKPLIQQYFVGAIKKSLSQKYSWGDSISNKKIKKDIVSLPVDIHGNIDFEYMEKYIKVIQKLTIKDVVNYKNKIISKTKELVNQ